MFFFVTYLPEVGLKRMKDVGGLLCDFIPNCCALAGKNIVNLVEYVLLRTAQLRENAKFSVRHNIQFDVHGSVHRRCIFKYNQRDATLHNLFFSVKCSPLSLRKCIEGLTVFLYVILYQIAAFASYSFLLMFLY